MFSFVIITKEKSDPESNGENKKLGCYFQHGWEFNLNLTIIIQKLEKFPRATVGNGGFGTKLDDI